MIEQTLIDHRDAGNEQDFDRSVLANLLEIGDETMRRALSAQLLSDFRRMEQGLDKAEPAAVARVAHEMKGLAATIGAQRLADLAQALNASAERVSPGTLAVLIMPVRKELAGVLSVLETSARASRKL